MNNYFETNNKKDCNGCGTCALRCPKNAIIMEEDSEGFLYPIIDKEKCINCGICKKVCSNNPERNKFEFQKVYAAKNKNEKERAESTSGGMFKILAEYIISKNGIVFGAQYNNNLEVEHNYATTLEECKKFSGSKYVRSNLKNSYIKVEEFLNENKYVLFTGTPCQNYGLKKYLKKDYEKLILCEIMCHSNPSKKVFEIYKKNIELKNNKKIKNYYFRNKKMNNNPYAEFEDGTIMEITTFNRAFGKMLISRPSCSKCQFCDTNRKSDITIGDYWGLDKYYPDFEDQKGVSLLIINTQKGKMLFDDIKHNVAYKETTIEEAFKYNHNSIIEESKYREKFFKGISIGKINERNIIKYMEKYIKPFYIRILSKIKKIFKK